MSNGIPQFTVKYYLLGFPLGRPTTYSATSRQRRKRVNDILRTRFVAILIRLTAPWAVQMALRPEILRDSGRWKGRECCTLAAANIFLSLPLSICMPLCVDTDT